MLAAELGAHLGYERYAGEGRNSGNSRNGYYEKTVRTSNGEQTVRVPRDREGSFSPQIVEKYSRSTNELEEKILGLYAKGVSTRDIEETLAELYGVTVSATTVSAVTDKVKGQVKAWQNRPLEALYAFLFLDALHLKIRHNGKVSNCAAVSSAQFMWQWESMPMGGAIFWGIGSQLGAKTRNTLRSIFGSAWSPVCKVGECKMS